MARSTAPSSPLTFDLPVAMLKQIEAARKNNGQKTASETVRSALAQFDFENFTSEREAHIQISVRIPREQRVRLRRFARLKDVAIGELVRAAIANLQTKRKR